MAAALAAGLFVNKPAMATPYTPVSPGVTPGAGVTLPPPGLVPGKEFSEGDFPGDRAAASGPDAEQNVAWDGIGGVTDGNDYSGLGAWPAGGQVDALANGRDALYPEVIFDTATSNLLFSTGNGTTALGSGLMLTTEGEIIGLAGDISFETPGVPTKGKWADGATMIDDMTAPRDIDGLEIWGAEPPGFDSNKFSLAGDAATGVSIWDLGSGGAYLAHMTIFDAVTFLLGPPDEPGIEDFDLDALMVFDAGDDRTFGEIGDSLIFSIRQLPDGFAPSGFYATGSEIFKLDFDGVGPVGAGITPSYLMHGGHAWDKPYALAAMKDATTGRQLDLNALEAASVVEIPEPSRALLLIIGGVAAMLRRRVR